MKKKILSLCLVVALAATAIVGGTLAYFTDTEQATNTMVIGNVEINIEEYAYEDGKWAPFEDDEFVLYPVSNNVGYNMDANKIVHTFNTSTSKDDAYIRTIVLFEANDLLTDAYVPEDDCCIPGLHYGFHDGDKQTSGDGHVYHGSKTTELAEKVTIDGNDYWVVVFEEKNEEAIKYDEALYSLARVWMDKNITQDQIEGWYQYRNGKLVDDKVDIIVFSQGIQKEGLTYAEAMEALGTVDQTNLTAWIGTDDAKINDLDYKGVNPTEGN